MFTFLSKHKYLILILAVAFLAAFPLLHKGLIPTHDGEYHVIRFYEFDKILRSRNIYPRWAPDLSYGFGQPLFTFVYPLSNYFASFFHLFGSSFIDGFKLNMFFAVIIGAIFFYLFTTAHWGQWAGVVGSVFYTFSPYHFVDIYIRGSVGEVWALALFPACLWALTIGVRKTNNKYLFLTSLFLALIIFSHNILALMFFIFYLTYALVLILQTKNKIYNSLQVTIYSFIGLGMSAVFWLPALTETHLVTGLQIFDIKNNFAEIYELIFPSWGSGFSGTSSADHLSYQIGIANLLAVAISTFIMAKHLLIRSLLNNNRHPRTPSLTNPALLKSKNRLLGKPDEGDSFTRLKNILSFFVMCFFVLCFLMLSVSFPIWQIIPFMHYFQFPWRFLSLEIFVCSFLAASIFYKKRSLWVFIVIIFLPIIFGLSYAKPAYYFNRTDAYYTSRTNFIDGTNSPGNSFNTIWNSNPKKRESRKLVLRSGQGDVKTIISKPEEYKFAVQLKTKSDLLLNISFFPTWHVYSDLKELKTYPSPQGLIAFSLPRGAYMLNATNRLSSIELFSSLASLVTIFVNIILLGKSFMQKRG